MNQVKPQNLSLQPTHLLKWGLVAAGIFTVVAIAAAAYIWFGGGSGQPSRAVTAPSLIVSGSTRLFRITPEQSEVRFLITETLLGQPKTVVGATNNIAGEIALDFDKPAAAVVGAIRIDVRTLKTDNEIRNRTLRSAILLSNRPEFEFSTFTPSKLVGLPEKITLGEPVKFQIVGTLTVRDVSREVSFDATVTPVSRERLEGSAVATVRYKDFNITIPDAPGVANVGESVRLEIDFVAAIVNS